MKITKSQLREMVKEAVYKEVETISKENKRIAENIEQYFEQAPFLKEYKTITDKKKLLEFFGPFKKMSVSDLERKGKEKETKLIAPFLKDIEEARKQLAGVKLTNPSQVQIALETYVEKLVDLYQVLPTVDLDPATKAQASKPFAVAAYTLQSLSKSLTDAAEDLFSAVPRSSDVYSAGKAAGEDESALRKSMKSAGDVVRGIVDLGGRGMGVGRGR
jgi:hypothetical protein